MSNSYPKGFPGVLYDKLIPYFPYTKETREEIVKKAIEEVLRLESLNF